MEKITRLNAEKGVERLVKKEQYAKALEVLHRFKVKGLSVTKSTLKKELGLKPKDIKRLHYIEVKNPMYSSKEPMRLYLRAEASKLTEKK